eukprot:COSAG02_NODE_45132_length_360_cov_0.582375_1_plen_35_part_01
MEKSTHSGTAHSRRMHMLLVVQAATSTKARQSPAP